MSIDKNRGMGQLNLSLLEISTEDLKFTKRNIEDFLNNLGVVAESLRIRAGQVFDNDMEFEGLDSYDKSSQHELNNKNNIDDIEALNFYNNGNSFNEENGTSEQVYYYKDNPSNTFDDSTSSKTTITSPKPPTSPRVIKESKIVNEINIFLKSPRKKEDEFDEATVVKQFSQLSQFSPSKLDELKVKKDITSKEPTQLNQSFEDKENIKVPSFYFPTGRPPQFINKTEILNKIENVFKKFPGKVMQGKDFDQVCEAIGKPPTWSKILINGCLGGDVTEYDTVSYDKFSSYWLRVSSEYFDDASIFIKLLVDGNPSDSNNNTQRKYVIGDDFRPLLSYLIYVIHDLDVLKNAPAFHSAYIDTVITRIFWRVSRTWVGRITADELRKSNFLNILASLHLIDNINDEKYFFSYIHFYVIYCKFWELDEDHDTIITKEDLKKYSNEALPSRVIDRIMKIKEYSKTSTSEGGKANGGLSYTDFIFLLLADENKHHFKASEYWFRILDIDGDGKLSLEELKYFHEEIIDSIKSRIIDCKSMGDTLCHVFDMVSPANDNYITLNDIKKSKMGHKFYNTFVNINKFIEQEITDGEIQPFGEDVEIDVSEWDNFCNKQYELIVEDTDDLVNCDDELESFNFLDITPENYNTNDD